MKLEMKRIMIIGNGGAGKSTLARALAEKLKLPLYHLDKIYWLPGWKEIEMEVMNESVLKIASEEEWIIDGNYRRTLAQRAEKADTIIYLNFSTIVCLYGIIKRRYSGNARTDITEGCPEKIDMKFLNWVMFYKIRTGARVRELLSSMPPEKRVIELKSRTEVREFLNNLKDVNF
jgi:adenylate kinase family enzyme